MTISGIKTQLDAILATHLGLVESPDMFPLDEIPDSIADGTYQILFPELSPNSEFEDKADRFTPHLAVSIEVVKREGLRGKTEYATAMALMESIVGHVLNPANYAGAWKNVSLSSATNRTDARMENWMIIECKFDMIYTLTY
jgi:hypothetical protein